MRTFLYRLLWGALLVLDFVPQGAHAETVQFICRSEAGASQIAQAVAEAKGITSQEVDDITQPLIALGECKYLSEDMFVYVVYTGQTFGTDYKITVLGLANKIGEYPTMWG